MKHRFSSSLLITSALSVSLAVSLAGCSSFSGLTTASIAGQSAPAAAPVPAGPVAITDPMRRAVRIAETAARAEKCGFNFDPNRIRTNYLASEVQAGFDAAQTTRVAGAYDLARNTTLRELADDDGYCNGARTGAIKASLGKLLAGDFTVYDDKVKQSSGGLFSSLIDNDAPKETLNPDWIGDPHNNRVTKRAQ